MNLILNLSKIIFLHGDKITSNIVKQGPSRQKSQGIQGIVF